MSFRPTHGNVQIYLVAVGPPNPPIANSRITSWGLILLEEEDPSNAALHFIVPKLAGSFPDCDRMKMVLADPLKVDLTKLANPPPSARGWNWFGIPYGTTLGHNTGLLKSAGTLDLSPTSSLLSFVYIGKSSLLGSFWGYEIFLRCLDEGLAFNRYFRLFRSFHGPGGVRYAPWSWDRYLWWLVRTTHMWAIRTCWGVEETFRLSGFRKLQITRELNERMRKDAASKHGYAVTYEYRC